MPSKFFLPSLKADFPSGLMEERFCSSFCSLKFHRSTEEMLGEGEGVIFIIHVAPIAEIRAK